MTKKQTHDLQHLSTSVAVCITSFVHVEGVVEDMGGGIAIFGVGLVFNGALGWGRIFLMWDLV